MRTFRDEYLEFCAATRHRPHLFLAGKRQDLTYTDRLWKIAHLLQDEKSDGRYNGDPAEENENP